MSDPACPRCRRSPNRRCEYCRVEERQGGPTPHIEVVCDCGFREPWDNLNEWTAEIETEHDHEQECDAETRYAGIGDGDGEDETVAPDPPRPDHQRVDTGRRLATDGGQPEPRNCASCGCLTNQRLCPVCRPEGVSDRA